LFRYGRGHFFREHYDWFDPVKDRQMGEVGNRQTSIFVYLVSRCEGGTTVFPNVKRPLAQEWCDSGLLKCVDENGQNVERLEVNPIEGVAIFWQNFNSEGQLDTNTLHAGADVLNGTKYGLNIWTRENRFRFGEYYQK
jgi:prolyl 4-hydroxylase